MNTLPIYFHKTVQGVAEAGEVRDVAASYAKNVLIPRKLGSIATKDVREREARRNKKQARQKSQQVQAHAEIFHALESAGVALAAKADDDETLYAGIKPADVAAALKKQRHLAVPTEWIRMDEPIKKLGTHTVAIEAQGKSCTVTLIITRE